MRPLGICEAGEYLARAGFRKFKYGDQIVYYHECGVRVTLSKTDPRPVYVRSVSNALTQVAMHEYEKEKQDG